ncbi:CG0192-related protein [Pseudactinotalea sp.]|uniref:CG0192-related protein n=1 Tax=Pseudactinotalea sp. TaxID=1926260 RepID=UPI003B3A7D90
MAILHKATLVPSKGEVVAAWLPQQPWYRGSDPARPRPVASFRFDDPAGEVGIETMLVTTGEEGEAGPLWQVPMTYRGTPLDGGGGHLIATLEHSVLGTRYVYDALGDPVYLEVVRATIAEQGSEADLVRELGDGSTEEVAKTMVVRGTGGGGVDVVLERSPQLAVEADLADGSGALIGWRAAEPDLVLARVQ